MKPSERIKQLHLSIDPTGDDERKVLMSLIEYLDEEYEKEQDKNKAIVQNMQDKLDQGLEDIKSKSENFRNGGRYGL